MSRRRVASHATVVLVGFAIVSLAVRPTAQAPKTPDRRAALLNQTIAAMGGEARLRGLKSLTLESIGHGYALEQSERPEGPWLTTYAQQTEIRDYEHNRVRLDTQRRNWSYPQLSPAQVPIVLPVAAGIQKGTRWFPAPPSRSSRRWRSTPSAFCSPQAARDLRVAPDEMQQKIKQHVWRSPTTPKSMRDLLNPWAAPADDGRDHGR